MCKEMAVIPFNRVVDTKRIIGKMEGRGGGEAHQKNKKKQARSFGRGCQSGVELESSLQPQHLQLSYGLCSRVARWYIFIT
jgi:hypothetical protein